MHVRWIIFYLCILPSAESIDLNTGFTDAVTLEEYEDDVELIKIRFDSTRPCRFFGKVRSFQQSIDVLSSSQRMIDIPKWRRVSRIARGTKTMPVANEQKWPVSSNRCSPCIEPRPNVEI
jgi:hypothetical protein